MCLYKCNEAVVWEQTKFHVIYFIDVLSMGANCSQKLFMQGIILHDLQKLSSNTFTELFALCTNTLSPIQLLYNLSSLVS